MYREKKKAAQLTKMQDSIHEKKPTNTFRFSIIIALAYLIKAFKILPLNFEYFPSYRCLKNRDGFKFICFISPPFSALTTSLVKEISTFFIHSMKANILLTLHLNTLKSLQ